MNKLVHVSTDIRYSSVALIKSLLITLLSPKLSSKSTLCNTWFPIYLANRTQRLCELLIGFGIVFLQGCLQVHGQEGTVCLSLFQSLCKDSSISFLRIKHNIAEVVPTHHCHSLTQPMNHIQNPRPSINKELSSHLLPSPVEVMVAESQCY